LEQFVENNNKETR